MALSLLPPVLVDDPRQQVIVVFEDAGFHFLGFQATDALSPLLLRLWPARLPSEVCSMPIGLVHLLFIPVVGLQ
jgi:hypothetical protein